jgi:hypothetical protein
MNWRAIVQTRSKCETLTEKQLKQKRAKVVEPLPGKDKALRSNTSTQNKEGPQKFI